MTEDLKRLHAGVAIIQQNIIRRELEKQSQSSLESKGEDFNNEISSTVTQNSN